MIKSTNTKPDTPDNTPIRYLDTGDYINIFAYKFASLVRCIRCDKPAKVYPYQDFYCPHCQLHLHYGKDWSGNCLFVYHGNCLDCGKKLHGRFIKPYQKSPHLHTITCSTCHYNNSIICDSTFVFTIGRDVMFGMPLYLSTPCRFGELWVYNHQHLSALKAFIYATLRERKQEAGNSSMPSRLPYWIKSAKNKKLIKKLITRLEILDKKFMADIK